MRIFVITVGPKDAGSTKFRIFDYLPFLEKRGVEVDWVEGKNLEPHHLKQMEQADVVINQKCLLNKRLGRAILQASRRLIFDFDDAIWTRPGKPYGWWVRNRVMSRIKFWLKGADCVVPANAYLEHFARKYTPHVRRIPMALNETVWGRQDKQEREGLVIGWAGAPVNLPLIERLDDLLSLVLTQQPQAELRLFSGQKPDLHTPFTYVPYREGGEVSFIQSLDIGLLPLENNEFGKGKSPIKAIQYLACGVPVVGNIYGATQDILNDYNSVRVENDQGWVQGLNDLITNVSRRRQLGAAGREHFETYFGQEKTAEALWSVLTP